MTSRPAEYKGPGKRKQKFCCWVTSGDSGRWQLHFSPLIPALVNPGYWRNSTIYCLQISSMSPSGEPCPSPARYCHLTGTGMESSKGHLPFCQASSFRMVGNMVRWVSSMSSGPLSHFSCYKIVFSIKSNVLYSTLMVDKALCKLEHGSFGKSTTFREGKSISRVLIYFSKTKTSLSWWK